MRDIKFRGKRNDNGEWIDGDLVKHYENQRRFIACDQLAYTYSECGIDRLVTERFYEIIPETVGQYTGLTDKNGVEICEGDIVRNGETIVYSTGETRRFEDVGIVRYDTKNGCLVVNNDVGRTKRLTAKVIENNHVKVIGNIHENPELMGEKGN